MPSASTQLINNNSIKNIFYKIIWSATFDVFTNRIATYNRFYFLYYIINIKYGIISYTYFFMFHKSAYPLRRT